MNDYKEWVSSVFDRAAPEYGKRGCAFFNYFGRRLVERVWGVANQCALDVATGRGAVLFPLAQAVGPLGKVVGIDISREMLKEATQEAKERALDWVEIQYMDAEQLHFSENYFDCVFCGFALFFFPSIQIALSEFNRVLKPGGRLAVSIWGKKPDLVTWLQQEIKTLSSSTLAVSPVSDPTELHMLLEQAGLVNIQIFEETKVFFHNTPEEWWDSLWTRGSRAALEQLSSEQVASLHQRALKRAQSLNRGPSIAEELEVFYGIAQKSP